MRKTLLMVMAMLFVVCFGQAQNNFWKESNEPPSNKRLSSGRIQPVSYKIFSLDLTRFKAELHQAPVRGVLDNREIILTFPNPDGELQHFSIIEADVLHPDLAAKYPGIKSYAGQGIEDPTATVRFSVSEQYGLHGMVMSGSRWTYYIDPYSTDRTSYKIYGREELDATLKDFVCNTENAVKKEEGKESVTQGRTNDKKLRRYRLALSCTAEYGNIFAGTGSDAQIRANILAQMNITMTRVNGIFERDLAITMQLVSNNDQIIYYGATNSDPWTNEWNNKTQQVNDQVIGNANYDIGHNFNTTGGGNAGCIECVCVTGQKGKGFTGRSDPTGDAFDIDYVAHEMGHQYGGFHTQASINCISGDGTTEVEPGSASTIMGYAGICTPNVQNNSDAYFHYVSIRDISDNVQSGPSSSCPVQINLSNNPPTANAGLDYTVPKSTALVLRGQGSDPDGDAITYTWEQNDPQPENSANSSPPTSTRTVGPMFRSFEGTSSPDRYLPRIQDVVNNNLTPTWEVIPSVGRTLNFALTVRDNRAGGGQTSDDLMVITVSGSAGPFTVTAPNSNVIWTVGQSQTVTWNVASTNVAPVSCANVNIKLSTDGGFTYPITLVSNTPNDGSQSITVPNNVSSTCRVMVEAVGNIFYDISNANFSIQSGASCNPTVPTGLAAGSITTTSASLSWTAVSGATYDVRYRISGTTTWTTLASSSPSIALSGLTSSTVYEAQVRSVCSGTTSSYSSSVTFTTATPSGGCTSTITTYPYTESFEGNIGAWTQSTTDNLDWTVDSDGTPSASTGPSSATAGTFYIYTEASTSGVGFPNKVAIITSPCFNLAGQTSATLTFDYHMYGADMGSLNVEASTNGTTWTSLLLNSGDKGNVWNSATVSLSAYAGLTVTIRFVGTTGSNYQSDMAIDNVTVTASSGSGGCTGGIASFPYQESFEGNIGTWTQSTSDDMDWIVDANGTPSASTGPSSAIDGTFYLYTEASTSGVGFPNKQAILVSPCFNLSGQTAATATFGYHMYGADMGSLSLEASTNGTSWTSLWSRSGNQGNSWQVGSVNLSAYIGGNVSLRFVGITGSNYRSDMAIDDFEITTGSGSSCTAAALTLHFDNYPEETSWTITDGSGATVASGGIYGSAPDGSTLIESACLSAGCYTFTMFDSYGDGMCCSFGNGSFSLSVGGTVVASGGSFASSTSTNFCVTAGAKNITSRFGEEQAISLDHIQLYPNPVRDELFIQVPDEVKVKSIDIISTTGLNVRSVQSDQRQVNVSSLSNGMYILYMRTDKRSLRYKFIKE